MSDDVPSVSQKTSPKKREAAEKRGSRTRTDRARNYARWMRQKSTVTERGLWRLLRDRKFEGFKFRRQYACGPYFLDFYCPEAKLAVELDGGGHGRPDKQRHDQERDKFLAGEGVKTLRFWNHQLTAELSAIRFEIWYALMERTGRQEEICRFIRPAVSNSKVKA